MWERKGKAVIKEHDSPTAVQYLIFI